MEASMQVGKEHWTGDGGVYHGTIIQNRLLLMAIRSSWSQKPLAGRSIGIDIDRGVIENVKKKEKIKYISYLLIIGVFFSLLASVEIVHSAIIPQRTNPIALENQKPGTTEWESKELAEGKNINFPDLDMLGTQTSRNKINVNSTAGSSTWTDSSIRGYANTTSINHGDAINFYVGTTPASYNLQIYRMGWYGGTGSTLVKTISNLPGQNQPIPSPDPNTQLLELNWSVSYTLQTDSTWTTGAYLAKLIATDTGSIGYIPFVIRDDSSTADILYQVPVNTWQAYNVWGGSSLYRSPAVAGRGYKVSFDRPYSQWDGAGGFFDGDYNMIRFLESQGYNISYATSIDTQTKMP